MNLVDFDECNLPVSPRSSEASTAAVASPERRPPPEAELRHLRQMLSDAAEEKQIQVAIVEDELLEQRRLVAELKAKLEATKLVGREAGRGDLRGNTSDLI